VFLVKRIMLFYHMMFGGLSFQP